MSSAKWSSKGSRSTVIRSLELMTLDSSLPNATANQLMTLTQLLGDVTSSGVATGVIPAPPSIFVYTGATDGTRTLPAGSANIVGMSIRIWLEVTGDTKLTVSPNGTDALTSFASSTTSGSVDLYGGTLYNLIWTGSIWLVGA